MSDENKVEKKPVEKEKIIELPKIYNNDFEDNSKQLICDDEAGKKEWGIITDEDNNHVYTPIHANNNSDAFFFFKESGDFIFQFRFNKWLCPIRNYFIF